MILLHTRLNGVTVLATGVATVTLLLLLLFAHATGRIGFLQAIAASVFVSLPIAWIGLKGSLQRDTGSRQLFSEAGG